MVVHLCTTTQFCDLKYLIKGPARKHSGFRERGQPILEGLTIVTRSLEYAHAFLDGRTRVAFVIRRVNTRQQRYIHPKRLRGEFTRCADGLAESAWIGLREGRQNSYVTKWMSSLARRPFTLSKRNLTKSPCLRYRRCKLGKPNPESTSS